MTTPTTTTRDVIWRSAWKANEGGGDANEGVHDNLEESKELEQGHGPALRERDDERREWLFRYEMESIT